jgi:hypothetical protein
MFKRKRDFTPPKWSKPAPLGYGSAVKSATYVASPLLAGFSAASIVLISTAQERFRWPGVTLLLLALSTILFIFSLQLGIICQKYFYSQADVEAWWARDEIKPRQEDLSDEQERDFSSWRKAAWRAMAFYNAGIVSLGASLATLLVPLPHDDVALTNTKWASVALVGLASVIAFLYGAVSTYQLHETVAGDN